MTTPAVEPVETDNETVDAADESLVADFDALDDPERASEEFVSEPPAPEQAESPPEPAPVEPPDPFGEALKDAAPVTYKVDGQDKTFDGIVVTKSGHGVIPPDKLDRLRNTLGLAEKSIADNRTLYERTRRFDQLGGEQKIAELSAQVAQLDAAGSHLLNLLNDPTALLMLDAEGNVVKNPKAIADLTEKLQFASKVAGFEAQQQFQGLLQQQQQQQVDTTQQGRALDAVIGQLHEQYPDLTPGDLAAAKAHFGQFTNALFRQATPADAQQYGYRIGEWLIDTPKMVPFFEERANLRREQGEAAKAREAAAAENRKRVASPPPPKQKAQPRHEDGTFAKQHKDREAERERLRSEINRAHRRGEFYTDSATERDV